MKISTTFSLLFLLLAVRLTALAPLAPQPLFNHMVEVNREWLHQMPSSSLLQTTVFCSDRERIQKHLELVESALRTRDMMLLSPEQRTNRLRHLAVLHNYWRAGQFPTNHYHAHRQPYFRDNYGVLCAVGFLLWQDGQHDAVDKINRKNNFAYIAELAGQYPELGAWAHKNGFSLEELAWIQPGYPATKPNYKPWGNGAGINAGGRINVMEKNGKDETQLFVAGSFNQIGGISANNIAVWNGQNWSALGGGVVGEVYDMEYVSLFGPMLVVVGDFYLPNDPTKRNVALWNGSTWLGIQTGDMEGKVLTVSATFYDIHIGGDFKKVNGLPALNAAKSDKKSVGVWEWTFTDAIAVNGTVRSIERIDDYLLFGGDFTQTSVNSVAGNPLTVNHLAYWYYNKWLTGLPGNVPPVRATLISDGYLYAAQTGGAQRLTAGFWEPVQDAQSAGSEGVRGFFQYKEQVYLYGSVYGGNFSYGDGLLRLSGKYAEGYTITNGSVRAAIGFQNNIYLAGNFTKLHSDNYPGMARIQLATVPTAEPNDGLQVQVTAMPSRLLLQNGALDEPTQLSVYDLNGRLLTQQTLLLGAEETELLAEAGWANGLYIWQLQNKSGQRAGKWVVSR